MLGESVPLSTILNEHAIRHELPAGYFKVQSDPLITEAFGLDASTELYGRCSIHRDLTGIIWRR